MEYIIYSVSYDAYVCSHEKDGSVSSAIKPTVYSVGGAVGLPGEMTTVAEIKVVDKYVYVSFDNGMVLRVKERDDTEYIYKPLEEIDNGGDIQDTSDQ